MIKMSKDCEKILKRKSIINENLEDRLTGHDLILTSRSTSLQRLVTDLNPIPDQSLDSKNGYQIPSPERSSETLNKEIRLC